VNKRTAQDPGAVGKGRSSSSWRSRLLNGLFQALSSILLQHPDSDLLPLNLFFGLQVYTASKFNNQSPSSSSSNLSSRNNQLDHYNPSNVLHGQSMKFCRKRPTSPALIFIFNVSKDYPKQEPC
jgi:hypothetical protein